MASKNQPHSNPRIASKQPKAIKVGSVTITARPRKTKAGKSYFVRQDGRTYWQARRTGTRDDRGSVWTGWATADEVEVQVAKAVAEGRHKAPKSSRSGHRGAVRTVGDLLDAWVIVQDERADLSDASKTCYRYKAGYWKDALGDVLAARLDRVDAEETVRIWGAGDAPVAPRTIKTAVRVLALAVRWGAARGHCSAIDLKGVAPTIREDERVYCEHTPLPAEALRVISLVPNIDKRDALLLQAITGARVGEIAAATGADYSPATGKLQLHGKDPGRRKRGKTVTRRFPLPPEGRAIVEAAIERNGTEGYLFPAMGNHPAPTQNNALKIACKAAGTPRFSTHALRRMVVMRMLDAGINAKTASKLTGHSVKTLLMHYVRPTEDALVRAVGQADLGNLRVGELIELPAPAEEGQEAAPAAASA